MIQTYEHLSQHCSSKLQVFFIYFLWKIFTNIFNKYGMFYNSSLMDEKMFHLSRCLMFLLCRNWLISTYSAFFPASTPKLCRISFLSSLIFKSLRRYSFSFSFNISNFFSYSSFFCSYSMSIALIFYCHNFSYSFLSCSKIPISSSKLVII